MPKNLRMFTEPNMSITVMDCNRALGTHEASGVGGIGNWLSWVAIAALAAYAAAKPA